MRSSRCGPLSKYRALPDDTGCYLCQRHMRLHSVSTGPHFVRVPVGFCRPRFDFGLTSARVGRTRPTSAHAFARIRPKLSPHWLGVGRICSKFDRIRPEFDESGPQSTRHEPSSTKLGLVGHRWANFEEVPGFQSAPACAQALTPMAPLLELCVCASMTGMGRAFPNIGRPPN